MKLHFAFGNPRKRGKHKKKVARKRKKLKTGRKQPAKTAKNPHQALRAKLKKAIAMAHHQSRKRRKSRRKNPAHVLAYKTKDGKKKLVGSAKFPLKHEYMQKVEADKNIKRFEKMLKEAKDPATKAMVGKRLTALKAMKAKKFTDDIAAQRKYMQRLEEEGAELKYAISKEKEKVAKKKGKGKKKGSKKGKKRSKAQKAALKKMPKAAGAARKKKGSKKSSKKKGSKKGKRRYPKMLTHKHAKSTRHIHKGSRAKFSAGKRKGSYKISTHFGKGKKKVKMTGSFRVNKRGTAKGSFRINPFRRNPLKDYIGLKPYELFGLLAGGALTPLVNGAIAKYAPAVVATASSVFGPQLAGSAIPALTGIAINVAAHHLVENAKWRENLKHTGDGLIAAGLIGAAIGFSQHFAAPRLGLAGINYTPMSGFGILPTMGDIRYTPMNGMGDIRYTPGVSGMGIVPQLAGPDFGAADYGGNGGSREAVTQRSDFGAWQSEDSEFQAEDDNAYSSAMN